MIGRTSSFGFVALAVAMCVGSVQASPVNMGPPAGAILDLDGTPIPHTYTQYMASFTATSASTNLSFAFRDDPAFLHLDDVTLYDDTAMAAVPVVNGDFEMGPNGANAPTGWTYLNSFGAGFGGVVDSSDPHGMGMYNYDDGAVQAYDGITQAIATTVGDTYTVSFWLSENSGESNFSRLSTNGDITDTGGNGIDLLVYAGEIPQASVPEPATCTMLMIGGASILGFNRRRRAATAS